MNETEIHLSPIGPVTCHTGMAIIGYTWACTTGEGCKSTVFTSTAGYGDNLSTIESVYLYLTYRSFLSIICNHIFDIVTFLLYLIFLSSSAIVRQAFCLIFCLARSSINCISDSEIEIICSILFNFFKKKERHPTFNIR